MRHPQDANLVLVSQSQLALPSTQHTVEANIRSYYILRRDMRFLAFRRRQSLGGILDRIRGRL